MEHQNMYDGAYWLRRFNAEKHCNLVLGKHLGTGLMGKVYEVSAPKMDPRNWGKFSGPMVMKFMWTDLLWEDEEAPTKITDLEDRRKWNNYYKQEIQIMSELRSCEYTMPLLDSYSFTVGDAAECRKVYLLLMPRLQTLDDYWEAHHNQLKEGELVEMSRHVAQGLAACHKLRILHRDIKPNNIYVQILPKGGRRYILADFGCCWSFKENRGCGKTFMNDFSPPEYKQEAAEGKADKPKETYTSDVYQLGRMLYYLITEALKGSVDPKNEKFIQMKPAFREFIIKATERNPAMRWKNGAEMVEALSKADRKSGTVISVNRNYRAAMQALRGGRYDDARIIAAAGIKAGEEGCALLELYCRVREYLMAPDAAELERLKEDAVELSLAGDGNPAAKCLGAILANSSGDRASARKRMKAAADNGFVPAGYLYGRMLYDDPSNAGERQEGSRYILKSAEAGYWDAMQFAKVYLSSELSDDLRRRIAEAELAELDARDGKIIHRRRMHWDSVAAYL